LELPPKWQRLKGFCLSNDAGKVKVQAPVLNDCHGLKFFSAWLVMLAGLSVLSPADAEKLPPPTSIR
jgi:hypothetical protein